MGKQLCLVTPVLAGSLGCHIPNCSWTVGLEADVGVKSSPAHVLWVENDLQSWSRKFWDILPNLAEDEEQRRTHWTLVAPYTEHRLGVQLLPNFELSRWFSFVREVCSPLAQVPAALVVPLQQDGCRTVPQKCGVVSGAEFSPCNEILL